MKISVIIALISILWTNVRASFKGAESENFGYDAGFRSSDNRYGIPVDDEEANHSGDDALYFPKATDRGRGKPDVEIFLRDAVDLASMRSGNDEQYDPGLDIFPGMLLAAPSDSNSNEEYDVEDFVRGAFDILPKNSSDYEYSEEYPGGDYYYNNYYDTTEFPEEIPTTKLTTRMEAVVTIATPTTRQEEAISNTPAVTMITRHPIATTPAAGSEETTEIIERGQKITTAPTVTFHSTTLPDEESYPEITTPPPKIPPSPKMKTDSVKTTPIVQATTLVVLEVMTENKTPKGRELTTQGKMTQPAATKPPLPTLSSTAASESEMATTAARPPVVTAQRQDRTTSLMERVMTSDKQYDVKDVTERPADKARPELFTEAELITTSSLTTDGAGHAIFPVKRVDYSLIVIIISVISIVIVVVFVAIVAVMVRARLHRQGKYDIPPETDQEGSFGQPENSKTKIIQEMDAGTVVAVQYNNAHP